MDGSTKTKLRAALAAVGVFALAGSISGVSAAEGSQIAMAAEQAGGESSDALARFEPSVDALAGGDAAFALAAAQPEAADGLAPDAFDAEQDAEDIGTGVASWYGAKFAGRKTASGERFNPGELTAAHRTLPFGSKVRVTRGGKSVVVRINDRGPFHGNRVIDLSQAAAAELDLVRAGSGRVELALLDR